MSPSPDVSSINGFSDSNGHQTTSGPPPIINIQQSTKATDLEHDIVEGLRSEPKYLPSVLLWNTDGLRLFDEITRTPDYYPTCSEIDILNTHVDDIAKNVVSESVVIELGSGNLKKTMIFLKALARQQKAIHYYALDLSESELQQSLSNLAKVMGSSRSPYITCQGLLGSYEDVTLWLQKAPAVASKPKYYIWMGNSIANTPPQEAIALLTRLGDISSYKNHNKASTNNQPSFIIAVDNCRDPATIERAYSIRRGQCGDFILTSLKHVNALAEREIFQEDQWALKGVYDERDRCYRSFYVAQKEMTVGFSGEEFRVTKGEHIRAMQSWKWDLEQIEDICEKAALKCRLTWQHERVGYGIYLLEPTEKYE